MVGELVTLGYEDIEVLKGLMLDDFQYWCQGFIPPDWFDLEFHGRLCHFLQDGASHDKLVVMARTHLKTTIAGTHYPLWRAVRAFYRDQVDLRTLITCNTAENARKSVRQIRGIVEENPLFQVLFPEVIPDFTRVKWTDSAASLNRRTVYPEETFEAAGIGSNIIRRHFNLIIEDDTLAPKKDALTGEEVLPTLEDIEKAIGFHKLTIPLLITYEEDQRVYIGTRWAAGDVIQHIKDNELISAGGRFGEFDVPALVDGKNSYKRFSLTALKSIRQDMGPYMFSALYLNEPVASEFMKFRRDWVRYYVPDYMGSDEKLADAAGRFKAAQEEGKVVVTVDPADPPTGRRSQDYSSIVSCLHSKYGLFILRYRRARVSEGQLLADVLDVAELDGASVVRVEVDRYANLEAGFRVEMANRNKYFQIDPVKTRGKAKEARILRLAPLFENGMVFLRPGMNELENELFSFPRGKHDDIIDALAWQVLKDFRAPDPQVEPTRRTIPAKRVKFSLEDIKKSMPSRKAAYPFPFSRPETRERFRRRSYLGV